MLGTAEKHKSVDLCELLLDASIDRVMALNIEWRITAWNRTSELVTGLLKTDVLGKHLLDVFPALEKDPESIESIHQALDGKKSFLFPNPHFHHRAFYETHFIPLEDEDGQMIGVMNLMHDVSHRIKAEQELQRLNTVLKNQYDQLEKTNAELSIFTAITGKDLKEPVRKLYTGLELLVKTDGSKLSDNSKGGLRRMQASLTKMSLMLDDVLAFSSAMKFEEKFEPLQLDEVLKGALTSLESKIIEKRAVIETEPLPVYKGSAEMLHYLFYNIIDNALKFQNEGTIPWIKIHTQVVSDKASITGLPVNPFLCLYFTDNGIGFPQESSKRMFNMFERLHSSKQFSGAGIGLAISRKIMEAHGGYIEAENVSGGGAVLKCYFPLS